jgi:hypothetical protein
LFTFFPGRTALLASLKPLRSLYFADRCFAAGGVNFPSNKKASLTTLRPKFVQKPYVF